MIGKISIGKSFGGCIKYCLNDKLTAANGEVVMKNRAELFLFNQCYGNQQELIRQFNEVRRLNTKLSKPVLHITLSLAPGEHLAKDKMIEMCQACAMEMGFENNQYMAIQHGDTNHQHFHIVANRIGFDKRTVSDSKNFQRIACFCRKMELKYELKQVLNPRQFLPQEQRQIPRQDVRKQLLQQHIRESLKLATNYLQFEQKMKAAGYQILKGRGISFIDNKKVKIKGSEVGFSLMKIEKILSLKQQADDHKIAGKINEKSRVNNYTGGDKQPPFSDKEAMLKKQDQAPNIDLQKQIGELIYGIIKPEPVYDQVAPELLRKRKVKKRKRQHF